MFILLPSIYIYKNYFQGGTKITLFSLNIYANKAIPQGYLFSSIKKYSTGHLILLILKVKKKLAPTGFDIRVPGPPKPGGIRETKPFILHHKVSRGPG